ncbi:unnamed protein product [Heligmosomoides polygyrus]|uniref:Uncharacterized protein n=1 Tax=Heligmosomoides polygyrus TaxID=6339 RepID=A0A183FFY8_HELPZ|nr:unnamed protein product [Heligmosomoides polygyrus]
MGLGQPSEELPLTNQVVQPCAPVLNVHLFTRCIRSVTCLERIEFVLLKQTDYSVRVDHSACRILEDFWAISLI